MSDHTSFYQCSLLSLVKLYYDGQSWIKVLKEAEADDGLFTNPKKKLILGIDNCDLAPFLKGKVSDSIYKLSRYEMVNALTTAAWAKPVITVPPATIVEYACAALLTADRLGRDLDIFDSLLKSTPGQEFEQAMRSTYKQIRMLLEHGPDVDSLKSLKDMLADGTLATFETAVGSDRLKEIASNRTPLNPIGFELLQARRRLDRDDYMLSCLIDMANIDLFVAADNVFRGEDIVPIMTTSGNLTLRAFKDSCPGTGEVTKPCRHLASPYVWLMVRQHEPSQPSRAKKIQHARLTMEDIVEEIERLPEAQAVIYSRIDNLSPGTKVGISKRLYDALRAWLDLFFLPYIKGVAESPVAERPQRGEDVSEAVDWVRSQRERIEAIADMPKNVGRELGAVAGFENEEFVERFVPDHPNADKVLAWLRG